MVPSPISRAINLESLAFLILLYIRNLSGPWFHTYRDSDSLWGGRGTTEAAFLQTPWGVLMWENPRATF